MSSYANSPLQPANRATSSATAGVWSVGALCHAVADTLDARFGAVRVQGEIAGFMRAASGHCYFTLKDAQGQLRCAMFRRAASLLGWEPRDGDQIEVSGRLAVYEARGDLQLIVESMRRAGQGALYEAFLRIKAEMEAQGLFDAARKRPLTPFPRGLGLVTSLGAAALRDVATALQRRAPPCAGVAGTRGGTGHGCARGAYRGLATPVSTCSCTAAGRCRRHAAAPD